MPLARIVSGGQTGVDRGALDAALDAGFPCGGWAPAGRVAEDGPIAARYPLVELDGGGYEARTAANVRDSDGTAILYFTVLEGGTQLTREYCEAQGKPFELVNASTATAADAAAAIAAFIRRFDIAVLNVAGPRASKAPRARDYAYDAVTGMLRQLATRADG